MTAGRGRQGVGAGVSRIAGHRLIAMGLQLAHCAWFASTLDEGFDPRVFATSGVLAIALYSGFLVAEYRWNGFRVTPVLFYLAAGIFRLGTGALFIATAVGAGEWALLRVGIHDVSRTLGHGHWLLLLGDWCFLAGYFAISSLRNRDFAEPAAMPSGLWHRVASTGMATAVAAFLLRIGERYVSFGGLASLAGYLIDYGVVAGAYLILLASRHAGREGRLPTPYAPVAYCLLGLNLLGAFYSYMKTDILISILPLLVLGFERAHEVSSNSALSRLFRPVVATMLVLYAFLVVVPSYSLSRRADFWGLHSGAVRVDQYTVSVQPYLIDAVSSAIPGTPEFREAHRFPDGLWTMIARMSNTPFPAWIYREVEAGGFRPAGFFDELLLAITPRILWPDKPLVRHGVEFGVTIGQASNEEAARSSVATTMQGAWYWRGGYLGLMAGCAISGAAFALMWLLFRNETMLNPASALVVLMLCHEGFRWFESAFLGGFPMYAYILIVFLPLQIAMRRVVGYRRERRKLPGRSSA